MESEKCYAKMQDGSVLYYEKIGKGKPLFLLHGNGGSSAYFANQIAELSQKHQLYFDRQPWAWQINEYPQKIDFFLMANDLYAIIQKEHLSKVALLGF